MWWTTATKYGQQLLLIHPIAKQPHHKKHTIPLQLLSVYWIGRHFHPAVLNFPHITPSSPYIFWHPHWGVETYDVGNSKSHSQQDILCQFRWAIFRCFSFLTLFCNANAPSWNSLRLSVSPERLSPLPKQVICLSCLSDGCICLHWEFNSAGHGGC